VLTAKPFEPARPHLTALAILLLGVAILSLPMLTGQFLAGPWSDQYATGYAFRAWLAEQWRATGHVPLWNPEIFGGLPFVAAQHGDIFYPTAWLRLVLPTATAMNLGFLVHYVLAGFFTYLLLRRLTVSWTGGVVGGVAYQLTGVVGTLVSPGHDGKLYVSALLPLALLALVLAIRERRFEGYALLALAVGLSLLSPHYQMVYYLLIAAGVFALYLTFGEQEERTTRQKVQGLSLAAAAVVVGFGIAMIQVLPFFHYLPYSPRAEGYGGFATSASYGIPWEHVPEFLLARFAGDREVYWGSNFIKLHSEYLGLPVVALAVLGALGPRRRLAYWLGAIGLLFLLVSLSDSTPFYRLWWAVMPFVKQTRAPGMAFFVVGFVVAVLAAFGAERVERGEARAHTTAWLSIGAGVAVLALVGVVGGFAKALALPLESVAQGAVMRAEAGLGVIRWGAFLSGASLVAMAALVIGRAHGKVPAAALCLGLPLLVGADLWRNAQPFWVYSRVHQELHQPDPVTERLKATAEPYRVLSLPGMEVYQGSALMGLGVPQLLGHHGNELHAFDQLLGGKNRWARLASFRMWDLLAVRYVLLPTEIRQRTDSIPGYDRILGGVAASSGTVADLYERREPQPYARYVTAALKVADDQAAFAIANPSSQFDPSSLVLLSLDAPVEPAPVAETRETEPVAARVVAWEPGRMQLRLEPAAPVDGYVMVSENWYPDWQATVDGADATVARGNGSLITVVVPAGAEMVELEFQSADYRSGKLISLLSLAVVVIGMVVPPVSRRRKPGG
jgi:hypothetical protein